MTELYSFKEIGRQDIEKAGVKGAFLSEIYNNNLSVPMGFVIGANVFDKFLEDNNLKDKIKNLLSVVDVDNEDKVQAIANEAQKLIVTAKISESLKSNIIEAYQGLNVKEEEVKDVEKLLESDEIFVAVRSSTTLKDTQNVSTSGLHATFLNVKGVEKLIKCVQACWASMFTSRAVSYKKRKGLDYLANNMAVLVQKMVYSRKSGLILTVNPKNNNRDEIIVRACFGLWDAIISGKIDPDRHVIAKEDLEIKEEEIRQQEYRYILDEETGGKIKEELGEHGAKQVLDVNDIKELGRIGKKIESLFEKPMEIEWVLGDKIYIIQAKPIIGLEVIEEEVKIETYETKEEEPEEEIPVEKPAEEEVEIEEVTYEEPVEEEKKPEEEQPSEEKEVVSLEEIEPVEIEELIEEEKKEPKEEKKPELKEEKKDDMFEKVMFTAGNIIVVADMAITNKLKKRYEEKFERTAPNNFHKIITELKTETEIPFEEDIKKLHDLKNTFIKQQKTLVGDISFVLETLEKFMKEF